MNAKHCAESKDDVVKLFDTPQLSGMLRFE